MAALNREQGAARPGAGGGGGGSGKNRQNLQRQERPQQVTQQRREKPLGGMSSGQTAKRDADRGRQSKLSAAKQDRPKRDRKKG
jgi:hypothetical protein